MYAKNENAGTEKLWSLSRLIFALIAAAIILFFGARDSFATSTFIVQQGGTGSTTLSGVLVGNGTNPIKTASASDIETSLGFTPYNSTNPSGYISNITGLVTPGTNVTISGSGTSGSPYVINSTGSGGGGTISTSSPLISGQAVYATGVSTIASVGTSTPTFSTGLTYSGTPGNFIGGSSGSLTVNTTQNISTLSNLTVAGFVQTTSGGVLSSAALTSGQVTTALGYTPGTGNGTVTAVSVASTNGFAGTSSGGATPALTLSTSITGILKGNGTAISAASAGTDYLAPTGSGAGLTGIPTSVSNSDSSLTVSPTTGSVVASLNTAHANTWTALQQFNGNASTTDLTANIIFSTTTSGLKITDALNNKTMEWYNNELSSNGGSLGDAMFTWNTAFITNASTTNISSTGNSLFATSGGSVGIGTTTPFSGYKTEISTSGGQNLVLSDASLSDPAWAFRNAAGILYIGTTTPTTGATSTTGVSLASSASTLVGIATTSPAGTLSVNGTVWFAGLTTSTAAQSGTLCISGANQVLNESVACSASAQRYKYDIDPINSDAALDDVMQLQPVQYLFKPDFNGNYQNDPNYSRQQFGLIADQAIAVNPAFGRVEVATTTFEGVTYAPGVAAGLDDEGILAAVVGAVKEQQHEIDTLQRPLSTVEDNWQWGAIALLALGLAYQQWQIRRLKRI